MTKDDLEIKYLSMNKALAASFNTSLDDISEEDMTYAYPLQHDLSSEGPQYTEFEEIARGGVKKIIKVKDRKTDRSVAKAVLLDKSDRENIESFLREARLTSSLQHPNIIPIYDMGLEEDGSPYFIMEHLTGDTLADIVKKLSAGEPDYKERYSLSVLLDIFSRICDAIAYAHSQNIIHLDLKPENIHINNYGQVHVCDWGLGKILNSDSEPELYTSSPDTRPDLNILNNMTLDSQLKGTPGFMAPEQATIGGHKDKQTDIFSLGAILFFILSYKIPIQGNTLDELIQNTKDGKINSIDKKDVPESLEAITLKALQKEARDRYPSVEELSRDLDKYRHGFATSAEDAGFLTQLRLLIKRHKTTAALITFFTLISLIAGVLAFQKIDQEKNQAVEARNHAQNQQKIAEQQQQKAEESLALYLNEKELTEKQDKDIDNLLFDIASSKFITNPKKRIEILEQGIKRVSDRKTRDVFAYKIAILNFVLQNFNQTNSYLNQLVNKKNINPKLMQACKKYAKMKTDEEWLTDKELADLINFLSHTQRYEIPSLFFYHMKGSDKQNRTPEGYWPLAKAMLTIVNNYWNTEPLDRELLKVEGGYSLDLSGTRYRIFKSHSQAFGVNILEPLKLKELDLSHTPFFEFWQLGKLDLRKLNLNGCWIREISLSNLRSSKTRVIKELTIDSSLYSKKAMDSLKKHFNVIDTAKKK